MRFIVQVRIEDDPSPDATSGDREVEVVEVADIERGELSNAPIGLSIAMRFTVLANTATNLIWTPDTAEETDLEPQSCTAAVDQMRDDIGRAKWFLWHGNLHRSLQVLDDVHMTLECCGETVNQHKALDRLVDLIRYLVNNQDRIPNYGERRRSGEAISSARGERRQPDHLQTHGQETTNAMDAPRRPPPPTNQNPGPRPPTRQRHPPMASHHSNSRGSVTSPQSDALARRC